MIKNDYKPRVLIIFLFFLFLYLIITTRLYILQIYDKDFFKNLAKQQYLVELTINPNRAKIYDRTGTHPLAFNIQSYSAFILPSQFKEKEETLKYLKKNYKSVYQRVLKNKDLKFLWLERILTDKRFNKLKNTKLSDIHFLTEPSRFYPYPSTSTIVGFTDTDNSGLSGIELQFNKRLEGKPTDLELKKDARQSAFYFDKKIIQEGHKGKNVRLTLDPALQFLVQSELEKTLQKFNAKQGAVLIMNPDNGEILSMVNMPSFDPNKKPIKDLATTKNLIVTETYEFGSVIKTFSALAALDEGVVTPDEMIDCEGKSTYINRFKVENWKALDNISFTDVIRLSSNVGIAKVVKRLGPKFYTHFKQLGFGQKTGIQFPGERSGFLNPPENWSRSSLIVMSFGYEIMATILQLTKAFCIIANGGYDIQPILVKKPARIKNTTRKKIYKSKSIKQIKKILETVGKRYSNGLDGFRVMGKTGTARSLVNGKYSKKKHRYSFAGIIEKGDYRRVIFTFINEPKGSAWWASQISAPLFNKVAEKLIINDLTHGIIK